MIGRSAFYILLTIIVAVTSCTASLASLGERQSLPPAEFIKVGNYWEYAYEYDRYSGDILYYGNITMRVASEEQRTVSGSAASVFVVDLSGAGLISGDWLGNPVTGTTDYSGEDVRLSSNFSIASEHMYWHEYMNYSSGTLEARSDADIAYDPVQDDMIGDTGLTVGSNFTSRSQMTIEQWINDSSTNETQFSQNQTSLTFTLISENNPVVTSAGSFLCDKYAVQFQSEENELWAYWYYSDKAGNYVKSEGSFSWIFGLVPIANLELRSYSYSTDNIRPEANAGDDQIVNEGDSVTFDGSLSSDNVGIVTYNWTFTDTIFVNISGVTAYHVFKSEGVYVVNLTVLDDAGNSDWDTMTVTVEKKNSSILGSNAILIGGIAVVVVIALVAILLLRKRKGKSTPDTSDSFVFTVPPE